MIDSKSVHFYLMVLQCGSFEKAAQRLFVTPSAVSQRIRQLEERLDCILLIRGSPLQTTSAGAALLKYGQQLQQLDHALQSELQPGQYKGFTSIAIAVNADTLATWLPEYLARWCQQQQVLLNLQVDDQDQTHYLLQQGEVLACISAYGRPIPGCNMASLGSMRYQCVASPDYRQQYFPKGVNREAFMQAQMVRFDQKDFLQHQYLQKYFQIDGEQLAQHILPSADSYLRWLELGMGFGMTPVLQVETQLTEGGLVQLTPDCPLDIPLYWHQWGVETSLTKSLKVVILEGTKRSHRLLD